MHILQKTGDKHLKVQTEYYKVFLINSFIVSLQLYSFVEKLFALIFLDLLVFCILASTSLVESKIPQIIVTQIISVSAQTKLDVQLKDHLRSLLDFFLKHPSDSVLTVLRDYLSK